MSVDLAKEISGERVLYCIVVTPERTVVDHPAQFVVLPLYDGELGVAPGRGPLIGRLGYGELRILEGGTTRRFYVDGGFVEIADNTINVLTNRAIAAEVLDAQVIQEQLNSARVKPAHTDDLRTIRDRMVLQARGQLRVARRGG